MVIARFAPLIIKDAITGNRAGRALISMERSKNARDSWKNEGRGGTVDCVIYWPVRYENKTKESNMGIANFRLRFGRKFVRHVNIIQDL